jgi:hypothetical protein
VANTFIKPTQIARMALATLYANSVMLPLVYKDYSSEFTSNQGDTVTIRKPATFTAREYNSAVGIVTQDATETSTSVSLDTVYDVSVPVPDLDATYNMASLQEQIIQPAMEAIAQAVDTLILSLRDDVVHEVALSAYNASTNPHPLHDMLDAKRILSNAKVPMTSRYAVVDPYISSQWGRDDNASRADAVGDSGTALREGWLNRYAGFDNVESNNISDFNGVAFHPTAFAFVSRPMAVPRGAASAQVVTYKGLSIRVITSYDYQYKRDIVSLDLLCGVKTLDANRAVVLNGLADSV